MIQYLYKLSRGEKQTDKQKNSFTTFTGVCGFFLSVKFATSILTSLAGGWIFLLTPIFIHIFSKNVSFSLLWPFGGNEVAVFLACEPFSGRKRQRKSSFFYEIAIPQYFSNRANFFGIKDFRKDLYGQLISEKL